MKREKAMEILMKSRSENVSKKQLKKLAEFLSVQLELAHLQIDTLRQFIDKLQFLEGRKNEP